MTLVMVSTIGVCRGQQGLEAARPHVAAAIDGWVDDFANRRLGVRGLLRREVRLQPRYAKHVHRATRALPAAARAMGPLLRKEDYERLTHLDVLQKLLFFAESNPSPAIGDALLRVASVGIAGSFLDRTAFEVRELGHWTLARMKDQGTWFLVLRAAAGERLPVLTELRAQRGADEAVSEGPGRRVAALRLLGQRGLPVFRSTMEAALVDPDPRVRLAAAESMRGPWKAATIEKVGQVLARERHPVVSQALVRLLFKMLKRAPETMTPGARHAVARGAIAQLGKSGWRTDMDLLDLVEAYPHKSVIPFLIEALDLSVKSPDALVSAINKQASPLLRERAGLLLRAITGALVPIDDVQAWREFWQAEQDNIEVPLRLSKPRPGMTRTKFYGVPITGTSIAFLIDTSGSMDDPPASKGPVTGLRRVRAARTRLEAAKQQMLLAAQVMAPGSQYFLLSFADEARAWTRKPIKPDQRSTRSLTGLLSRLNARGGTNLYAGLIAALEIEGRSYGDAALPKIDELFLLSDGDPTTGDVRDADLICEMVQQANKYAKVRINAVFTGTGDGAALLRRLAEENDGVFVQR